MEPRTRRDFLADVGRGMLTASLGTALATDLSLSSVLAGDEPGAAVGTSGSAGALTFGRLEPLVELMQENSAERMLPLVVERMAAGTDLREFVAAAALANARTFGGEDYIGFHAFMALAPAYEMSREMPADRRALPVLKVLYRSTNQIQTKGGRANEVLHPIDAHQIPADAPAAGPVTLREAMRHQEMDRSEGLFAGMVSHSADKAFNDLQALVQDDADVHRTVLAYRAWDLLGLTGREHAHTTLRQSVRYCVAAERNRIARGYPEPGIRAVLPKVIDRYRLTDRKPGSRKADDAWVRNLCNTLLRGGPAEAAEAVASALADGFSLEAVGEALSLAATQQVLRDPGRTQALPGKPIGSVHGDSVGVHASDSMNAWRNMARASSPWNALTGLVVAGYHVAFGSSGRDWAKLPPYPLEAASSATPIQDGLALLRELDGAIRENDQGRAAALAARYGAHDYDSAPLLSLLRGYATSEDGALHAEKYYHTTREEFGRTRKAFRWEHLVALARVTASEYGKRADGYEQACGLLKVPV